MAGVRDHTELDVWKLSDSLSVRVRDLIDRGCLRGHDELRKQIEESAESPCSNIAEGFLRYLPRDNARFVRIAAGSLAELIRHLDRALARRLVSAEEHKELTRLARRALGKAVRYIAYLQTATPPHLPPKRRRPRRRGEPEQNGER